MTGKDLLPAPERLGTAIRSLLEESGDPGESFEQREAIVGMWQPTESTRSSGHGRWRWGIALAGATALLLAAGWTVVRSDTDDAGRDALALIPADASRPLDSNSAPRPSTPASDEHQEAGRAHHYSTGSDWKQAPPQAPLSFSFGAGAEAELAAGGRARLMANHGGAHHLLLETGRVRVSVADGSDGLWTVTAGPHTVEVVGTVFTVDWDPAHDGLEVEVERGEVEVQNGLENTAPSRVTAGRRLSIDRDGDKLTMTRIEEKARKRTVPALARPEWQTLFAEGRYEASLEAAERTGFRRILERGTASELDMLADAARLAKRPGRAEQVLLALRKRHPKTPAATLAAYDLGRIASDRGRHDDAQRWLRTYLDAAPRGAYARDARSRLLRTFSGPAEGGSDAPDAQRAAREYLRYHPSGPDASLARRVLGTTGG
jgi:hypothetical protein